MLQRATVTDRAPLKACRRYMSTFAVYILLRTAGDDEFIAQNEYDLVLSGFPSAQFHCYASVSGLEGLNAGSSGEPHGCELSTGTESSMMT